MYLIAKIDQAYFEKIHKLLDKDQFKAEPQDKFVEKLVKIKCKPGIHRLRVGIINFALSQLRQELYNPKVNLLSLFTGIWFKCGDLWTRYDVLKENYPT